MAKTTKFFNITNNRTTTIGVTPNAENYFSFGAGAVANLFNLQFSSLVYTVPANKMARVFVLDYYDCVPNTPPINLMASSGFQISQYTEYRLKFGANYTRSYGLRYSNTGLIFISDTGQQINWVNGSMLRVDPLLKSYGPEFGENNKFMRQFLTTSSYTPGTGQTFPAVSIGSNAYVVGISAYGYDPYSKSAQQFNITTPGTYSYMGIQIYGTNDVAPASISGEYPSQALTSDAFDNNFSLNNPFILLSAGETIEVLRSAALTISAANRSIFISQNSFNMPFRLKMFVVEEEASTL